MTTGHTKLLFLVLLPLYNITVIRAISFLLIELVHSNTTKQILFLNKPFFHFISSISMQKIVDFVNSVINNYHIDSSTIQNVQGRLNEKWKLDGWISLILSTRECVVLKFNKGVFMNEGFVVDDEKVLKVLGNHQMGHISYSEVQSTRVVEGIVDLDHGSRFEGLVLTDEKEGKIGIPFGYGEMYDDENAKYYIVMTQIMYNYHKYK